MKVLTFKKRREPGMRLNITDLCLIIFVLSASLYLRTSLPQNNLYVVPLYVGASFFLFCNVFRVGNLIEVVWYVPFTVFLVFSLLGEGVNTTLMLALFVPLQAGIVAWRIVKGPYVGVFFELVGKYDPDYDYGEKKD